MRNNYFTTAAFLLVLLIISISSNAQVFETVWERADSTRPDWFSDGQAEENSWNGTERGITYNPITERVYVASRFQGEPHVRIVDPLTGEDLDRKSVV